MLNCENTAHAQEYTNDQPGETARALEAMQATETEETQNRIAHAQDRQPALSGQQEETQNITPHGLSNPTPAGVPPIPVSASAASGGGGRCIAEPLDNTTPALFPVRYDETSTEAAAAQIAACAAEMKSPRPNRKIAACRFCGQFRDFTGEPISWGADIIEETTLRCDCPEARRYADNLTRQRRARDNRLHAMESAREAIEEMLGEQAIAGYGMVSVREETRQHILDTAMLIYDGRIADATIKITPCIKIKLFQDAKNKLIIRRNDSAEVKQEVDTR